MNYSPRSLEFACFGELIGRIAGQPKAVSHALARRFVAKPPHLRQELFTTQPVCPVN